MKVSVGKIPGPEIVALVNGDGSAMYFRSDDGKTAIMIGGTPPTATIIDEKLEALFDAPGLGEKEKLYLGQTITITV